METVGFVKGRIRLSCDKVGFVDSNSGCLVEALGRRKGGVRRGFSFIWRLSLDISHPLAEINQALTGARSSVLSASEKSMTYKDMYWRWS